MSNEYTGHYAYSKASILQNAPDSIGVYYCGYIGPDGRLLYPAYIGRAKGEGVSVRSRLLDHIRDDYWPSVTHFGYRLCATKWEAERLEAQEIAKFNPKYNTQLKSTQTLLGQFLV